MSTTYIDAPEVEHIALDLIRTVDTHSPLLNVEVRYVWRMGEPAKSKGKPLFGKARKVSGLNAYLARARDPELGFFVVEMSNRLWGHLEEWQQRALVDHKLSHCQVVWDENDVVSLTVVGHDVEEFHGVVRRHGAWQPEIATLQQIAGQQHFDLRTAHGLVTADGTEVSSDDAEALKTAADALGDPVIDESRL